MTPLIQKLIQTENVTDFDIETAAIKEGMVTMLQDGILKALINTIMVIMTIPSGNFGALVWWSKPMPKVLRIGRMGMHQIL